MLHDPTRTLRHASVSSRRGHAARAAATLAGVALLALGACKTAPSNDDPANAVVNADARKRLDGIRDGMTRGQNTSVPCAGAKTYAGVLAADKSAKSAALVAETKKLCEHEAPLAFARAAVGKMAARGSATDCAAVTMALGEIAAEHQSSPEVRDVADKHKKACQ